MWLEEVKMLLGFRIPSKELKQIMSNLDEDALAVLGYLVRN